VRGDITAGLLVAQVNAKGLAAGLTIEATCAQALDAGANL